jgi:hypothetical protein
LLQILEYLYTKKKQGECDKLFIYTNNVCTPPWVSLIIEYINKKLNIKDPLFDKIISAFKINNKIIEVSRTKREKSCSDLIRCTMLPKNTEICFIDDTYHKDMLHEKVFYIQPYPYYHGVSVETIIQRFQNSKCGIEIIGKSNMVGKFYEYMKDWFYFHNPVNFENKVNEQNEVNVFVAQKMMYHIKEFFYLTFLAPYRKVNGKPFSLLEGVIKNTEEDLNVSRNCFTTCSLIDLSNDLSKIKTLCDINCSSLVCSLTWSNIISMLRDYSLVNKHPVNIKPLFVVNVIFKSPNPCIKPTVVKFNYRVHSVCLK